MENFIFSSTPIEISEFTNHKEATFLISVLDEYNLNGVLIEKAEGETYHKSIIGYPILAYLKYDANGKPDDFGGHELRSKYNTETKQVEYYFATFPIGSVIDSWIEKRIVEGYEGEKDCILIKTKLWKSRFPEYFKVFDELWNSGTIASSWEISSSETIGTMKGKILKVFEFIGNTCLGKLVKGAVNGAGVLEVANEDVLNYELSNAFAKDIVSAKVDNINQDNNLQNKDEEDKLMPKASEENKNVASMTDNDLYSKVRRAINATEAECCYYYISRIYPYEFRAIAYEWEQETQDSHVEFTYVVNSDESISITSKKDVVMMFVPKVDIEGQISQLDTKISELNEKIVLLDTEISTKTDALVKASEEITTLTEQVVTLAPFKAEADKLAEVEAEKVLSEKKEALKKLAVKGGFISEVELIENAEIAEAIETLNESLIKTFIADRFMKVLDEKDEAEVVTPEPTVEVSATEPKVEQASANINLDDESIFDAKSIMSSFLKSK